MKKLLLVALVAVPVVFGKVLLPGQKSPIKNDPNHAAYLRHVVDLSDADGSDNFTVEQPIVDVRQLPLVDKHNKSRFPGPVTKYVDGKKVTIDYFRANR